MSNGVICCSYGIRIRPDERYRKVNGKKAHENCGLRLKQRRAARPPHSAGIASVEKGRHE